MNREDIIRMAKQSGMAGMLTDVVTTFDDLERFAQLVAAHERNEMLQLIRVVNSSLADQVIRSRNT